MSLFPSSLFSWSGWALLSAVLLLAGCEEEQTGIQPLPPPTGTEARRAPIAEPPSPAIVSPHLRRADSTDRAARDLRRSTGGGAGGGGGWAPPPVPAPSAREVEEFRRRLAREAEQRVDPDDDSCDQLLGVMRATAAAGHDPGEHRPELPSRAEVRRRCGSFSETFQECLSPEHFRSHLDECNAELARIAERGERQTRTRQRQWEAIKQGRPLPGHSTDG